MKKFFTLAAILTSASFAYAQGVYQIPNSDFETWNSSKEPGNGWNSFASAEGRLSTLAFLSPAPEKVVGYNSSSAVKLISKDMGLAKANGNLTTGTVNMGDTQPTSAENYNFTNLDREGHNLLFAGKPDAVSCMAKFKSGGSANGQGKFIIHNECEYRDPELSSDAGQKIADAVLVINESAEWTECKAEFNYTDVIPGNTYMLASFTTNPVPGGSANDELIIDDVRLLYYSELASLTYDGQSIFDANTTHYMVDADYDESKLVCTSNGKGATIKQSFDDTEKILTITVEGNDISVNPENKHEYQIQFRKAVPVVTEYKNSLMVNVMDQSLEPQDATINLIKELDNTYTLELNDFVFSGMNMGDIRLVNLTVQDGKIQSTQDITLEQMGTMEATLNATLDEEAQQLEAIIDIPAFMVRVTFADLQTYTEGQALNLNTGLTNIAYNRTFPEGWSTICLPFSTSVLSFGNGAQAQQFVSADDNGLNFEEVETLEANKPYLIYFPDGKNVPTYFGKEVEEAAPITVAHGNYYFEGSYEASMSMTGYYGLATIDGVQKIVLGGDESTLKATRAYFTVTGTQPAQVRINLEGETTGISQIENSGNGLYTVYTLQGILVKKDATSLSGLKPGIYVVNGKKVVIK